MAEGRLSPPRSDAPGPGAKYARRGRVANAAWIAPSRICVAKIDVDVQATSELAPEAPDSSGSVGRASLVAQTS